MPRFSVILVPEAEEESREAFLWYSKRDPRAAARFEDELTAVLARIADAPEEGPEIEAGVRRMLLASRFPYGVLYVIDAGRVAVLCVMHLRRRPGYWRGREP